MAKTKTRGTSVSKSDAIRGVFKKHPQATVKEVQAALRARGVKASDALINKVKYGRSTNGAAKKSRKRGKRSSTVNKADAIRGAWGELGKTARPRDVIALLSSRGVVVSSAQVSTLRKSAGRKRAAASVTSIHTVPYDHLMAAKDLAARVGGIDHAQQALASLARLVQA